MKKLLLVAAVAAFTMTSCKKDYTCECTVSQTVNGTTTTTTAEGQTGKMKKADAESKCDEGDSSTEVLGVKVVSECKIK